MSGVERVAPSVCSIACRDDAATSPAKALPYAHKFWRVFAT
jgi:hypothetical protein